MLQRIRRRAGVVLIIAQLQQDHPDNLFAYLPLRYWRAMMNGKARLQPLHNDRDPHIRPTTVTEYVAREGL